MTRHNGRRCRKPSSVVKSAARVLEVVDYISELDSGITAKQLVAEFGYPPSSACMLLKSLCTLGYLFLDRRRRTYHLTARTALMGIRSAGRVLGDGRLLQIMGKLSEQTGET